MVTKFHDFIKFLVDGQLDSRVTDQEIKDAGLQMVSNGGEYFLTNTEPVERMCANGENIEIQETQYGFDKGFYIYLPTKDVLFVKSDKTERLYETYLGTAPKTNSTYEKEVQEKQVVDNIKTRKAILEKAFWTIMNNIEVGAYTKESLENPNIDEMLASCDFNTIARHLDCPYVDDPKRNKEAIRIVCDAITKFLYK